MIIVPLRDSVDAEGSTVTNIATKGGDEAGKGLGDWSKWNLAVTMMSIKFAEVVPFILWDGSYCFKRRVAKMVFTLCKLI